MEMVVTLRCVIPVVCVTKWEVGAYSRTTQLIRRKDVLFYYEKTTCFGLHRPSSGFLPIKGSIYLSSIYSDI